MALQGVIQVVVIVSGNHPDFRKLYALSRNHPEMVTMKQGSPIGFYKFTDIDCSEIIFEGKDYDTYI